MKIEELSQISSATLRSWMKGCAMMDAVLVRKEWLRCYRFVHQWRKGIDLAGFENGAGDELVILFKGDSSLIKGFDHESLVSPHAQDEFGIWPGMYDGAPADFLECLEEEELRKEDVTFCFWRSTKEGDWQQGPVRFPNGEDDGSRYLLGVLRDLPKYLDWAEGYFGVKLDDELMRKAREAFVDHCQSNGKQYLSLFEGLCEPGSIWGSAALESIAQRYDAEAGIA